MSSPSHQFIFSNCSTQYNVAFINITPLRARENGNHAVIGIFGIAVTVLLTALQLEYQGRTNSPFQDHPKAMAIALASFLIFCLACDIEQYFCTSHRSCSFAGLLKLVLRLMGFMSLASLALVIFSASTRPTASLSVYTILPWFFSVGLFLLWIRNRNSHQNRGACNYNNLQPESAYTDYFYYIDTLPV